MELNKIMTPTCPLCNGTGTVLCWYIAKLEGASLKREPVDERLFKETARRVSEKRGAWNLVPENEPCECQRLS